MPSLQQQMRFQTLNSARLTLLHSAKK